MTKVPFSIYGTLNEYVVHGELKDSGKQYARPAGSPYTPYGKVLAITDKVKDYGQEPYFDPIPYYIKNSFYNLLADTIKKIFDDPGLTKAFVEKRWSDSPEEFVWPGGYSQKSEERRRKELVYSLLSIQDPWEYIVMDEASFIRQFGKEALNGFKTEDLGRSKLDDVVFSFELSNRLRDIFKQPPEERKIGGMLPFMAQYKYEIERKKKEDPNYKVKTDDFKKDFHVSGGGFIIIDHDTKQLYVDEEDVKYGNRMVGYTSGDDDKKEPYYVTVKSSFSIENPDVIRKYLAALIKRFPQLASYSYVDKINDGEVYAATDVMKRQPPGELGRLAKNTQAFHDQRGPITVFHGTSMERWEEIQKVGYMMAGRGANYIDKIRPHSDRLLYFTLNKDVARRYATRMARASKAVVLEITIDDVTKITFDEDNLNYQAAKKAEKAIGKEKLQAIAKAYGAWSEPYGYDHPGSLWKRIIYQISRNEKQVARQFEPRRSYETTPKEFPEVDGAEGLRFVRLAAHYAIKIYGDNGYSFGYAGRIPVSKIKVIEEFKSTRYYENKPSEEQQRLHQKAIDSWKQIRSDIAPAKKKRAPKGPSSG